MTLEVNIGGANPSRRTSDMRPKALVDEHQPFKLMKRDRYPTGVPSYMLEEWAQSFNSEAHGS